ncbi:Proteasome subunit beta type-7 [Tilletia horrida]|nr:Proteasome subunit beta type-7 [Tilletia horrida]KAK0562584.1 Proteasome subunit beta type-7 [Tilletia horrida]
MNSVTGQTWASAPSADLISSRAPVAGSAHASDYGTQRTQQPIITGTSVLGLKYKDGIMLAADTLASYGSLARFMDIRRLVQVGDHTVIGASGDMSDFQHLQHLIDELLVSEFNEGDGHSLTPRQLYSYLSRVMYGRRNKLNPYWNSLVLGGLDPKSGEPFLGYVDLMGTTFQSSTIATGYGMHIAQPLLRKAVEGREQELGEEEAKDILRTCMKVLFYRDARSLNRFTIATITKSGSTISDPESVPTSWGFAEGLRGYGPQTQ